MNFAKGILEARKQTYKHLSKLLKAIPLETPTVIELSPSHEIRVTLFDANHCVGAVMFLIEGDGKSVLYTGDIRSERWWVDSLVRNPILLPYVCGLKILDCIYLDTTCKCATTSKHSLTPADIATSRGDGQRGRSPTVSFQGRRHC
jgi:DNA cross-link repair 1C protein